MVRSDGQTECANRLIEDVLRHFVSADMLVWDKHLSLVQFAINNAWQETVQETPMFLNHGRHPKSPLQLTVLPPDSFADDFASKMRALIARAKRSMFAAQQRQSVIMTSTGPTSNLLLETKRCFLLHPWH